MPGDEDPPKNENPDDSTEGPTGRSGGGDQHEDEYDDEYGEQQTKGDPNAPVDDPRDDGYVDEHGNFDPTGNAGRGDDRRKSSIDDLATEKIGKRPGIATQRDDKRDLDTTATRKAKRPLPRELTDPD